MASNVDTANLLKFVPFTSSVDVGFWFELAKKKLDELRLDETPVPITGFYGLSTNADPPSRFNLDSESFKKDFEPTQNHFAFHGHIHNKNTIESFKSSDKQALLNQVGDKVRFFFYSKDILALFHPNDDFKVVSRTSIKKVLSESQIASLVKQSSSHFSKHESIFIVKQEGAEIVTKSLEEFDGFYDSMNSSIVMAGQTGSDTANWLLRNLLVGLKVGKKLGKVKILQYKCDRFNFQNIDSSEYVEVDLVEGKEWVRSDLQVSGWERNSKAKLLPKTINLSSTMDQKKLASNAVDLNLKLMRWRLLPNLQLEKISQTKCLLFGAGTLGCNVARNLMAWGVRHITFVDNGKISFSNPVRQWLYNFEDSCKGSPKAATAASKCLEIFPEMITRGVELTIPMPGHLVSSEEEKTAALENITAIENLIAEHDVSFLLLDSREARWLPTMISESKGKPVITSALGFDNFVVMRHGVHHDKEGKRIIKEPKTNETLTNTFNDSNVSLGCYFCNDVVAPQDSARDRTLDQQCTVTRPGLSSMASSTAVELLVTMLHHPLQEQAPGDPKVDIGSDTPTELGIVPHQVRGYLSFFSNMIIMGHRYDKCVACSDAVIQSYQEKGSEFLIEVFNNPKLLEDITGITAMKMEDPDTLNESWDTESDFDGLGEKNDLDDF